MKQEERIVGYTLWVVFISTPTPDYPYTRSERNYGTYKTRADVGKVMALAAKMPGARGFRMEEVTEMVMVEEESNE